ncbi:endonuclease/exonuclease/phosphatase family metal-dependent hydrolase [Pelomonas saccharophila]|uniref:Endonuclease/exonuclease/phosphatase family metal-dependent hydrolase n=1 Tax=Roseateles saccharophilus TaxID=304 RepID=A0ABU1YXS2_ROSSA|nr:endonuclease/exonuclease/phosphatase family protein [Roseateles saccharophilus]MDR7273036.1 endonuclease/exonuclease/phosphatase family metal-dependent hydrolase [Roseateles saccharophilus]
MPKSWRVGLAAALLLLTTATARAGEALRVATFNLRLNLASDAPNDWPHRKALVKALIQYHDWDLFGTQEALPEQVADLEQLPGYRRVGVGRDDGAGRGEHAAVFIRTSRLELLRQGTFWLSETPERPSKGWDARCCNRIVTWAELRDRQAPQAGSFFLFNTHFDHEGVVARRESARLLLSRWKALAGDAPALVIGDFNAAPGSEPVQLLRAALRDARDSSRTPPYGPEGTFQGFRIDAPLAEQDRIDHIFHTPGIEVLKWAALTDSRQGRFPSDHLPVQAVVRLP